MKRELNILLTAILYYTRIPCSRWLTHQEENLHHATRYLPLVGWLVGFVAALAFLAGAFLFGNSLGVLFSMAATILLTGAFHEDGFADSCDGFGGGWTKEKILEIMKDSRIGTYGVVGLVLLLGTKFLALQELVSSQPLQPFLLFLLFITAHSLSRFTASTFIFTHAYVRLSPDSKVKPVAQAVTKHNLFIGAVLAFAPLFALALTANKPALLAVLAPLYLTQQYLDRYFTRWIGGYTGDCLGATQQLSEVILYLSFILLWKFT